MRLLLLLVPFFLVGCQTTSSALDEAEDAVRETRVSYQERLDRTSDKWDCDGRSFPSLVGKHGTVEATRIWWNGNCSGEPLK